MAALFYGSVAMVGFISAALLVWSLDRLRSK